MMKYLEQHEITVGNGKYYLKGLTKQQFDAAIAAIAALEEKSTRDRNLA